MDRFFFSSVNFVSFCPLFRTKAFYIINSIHYAYYSFLIRLTAEKMQAGESVQRTN